MVALLFIQPKRLGCSAVITSERQCDKNEDCCSPGRVSVVFRKGRDGFLRQDPTEEARGIKDDGS